MMDPNGIYELMLKLVPTLVLVVIAVWQYWPLISNVEVNAELRTRAGVRGTIALVGGVLYLTFVSDLGQADVELQLEAEKTKPATTSTMDAGTPDAGKDASK